jgi:uncharacterized protein (DUF302 family)
LAHLIFLMGKKVFDRIKGFEVKAEVIMSYYFNKTLTLSFDKAIARVTEELGEEGFGILTDIDRI